MRTAKATAMVGNIKPLALRLAALSGSRGTLAVRGEGFVH
jgi:hypothetical protein